MLEHDKAFGREVCSQRGWNRFFVSAACAVLLALFLTSCPVYSRRPYTCAACRADRIDAQFLVWKWSRQEETDCSRWYREHVEHSHSHYWIQRTYCRRFGIPGVWGGYSCVVGGPLTGLSTRVHIAIYEHFGDRMAAKNLFIRLARIDADTGRVWQQLMDWVNADYPGTWDDWRKRRESSPD
jgi:hypothetical protein